MSGYSLVKTATSGIVGPVSVMLVHEGNARIKSEM